METIFLFQLTFVVCSLSTFHYVAQEFRKHSAGWFWFQLFLIRLQSHHDWGKGGGASRVAESWNSLYARLSFLIAWQPQWCQLLTCLLNTSRASVPTNKVSADIVFYDLASVVPPNYDKLVLSPTRFREREIMPPLNSGSGKVLEEQVRWEIQLCPSLETLVCSMETWGQSRWEGRHTRVALTICWRAPFTSTTELYRKDCVISFHFRQEKTYLAKVFLYTRPRTDALQMSQTLLPCLQCIILSISRRNKGEITWPWWEGGRTRIQSQVSLHLAHSTLYKGHCVSHLPFCIFLRLWFCLDTDHHVNSTWCFREN